MTAHETYGKSEPLAAFLHLALCSGVPGVSVPRVPGPVYIFLHPVCVCMSVWVNYRRGHNGRYLVPAEAGEWSEVIFLQVCVRALCSVPHRCVCVC